jgi:hypothetical protein
MARQALLEKSDRGRKIWEKQDDLERAIARGDEIPKACTGAVPYPILTPFQLSLRTGGGVSKRAVDLFPIQFHGR